MLTSKTLYIYTDGACTPNGKKNAKAGIGEFIHQIYLIFLKNHI